MSDADPTSEESRAASAASPHAVAPLPLLAQLDELISQQTLMLKLHSNKENSLQTLYSDMNTVFDKLRADWRGSELEGVRWNFLLERQSDYAARITEEQGLHRKMADLVRDSQRLRAAMLQGEREQGTEQTRKERDRLRDDLQKEKELHLATMVEVEALRRQLGEEKKLHEETRLTRDQQIAERNDKEKETREVTLEVIRLRAQLDGERELREGARRARDQFSEQNNEQGGLPGEPHKENNEQGGLPGEPHKENNELLEKTSKERKIREEMKREILEELKSEIREGMKSEIEKLYAELLGAGEHLREERKGGVRLEQEEQEKSRLVLLEQQTGEMQDLQQTTARD